MSEMETSTLDESQIESETRASYEGTFFDSFEFETFSSRTSKTGEPNFNPTCLEETHQAHFQVRQKGL